MNIITLNLTYHFLDFWVRVCVVCVWWEEWLNFSWKKHILCQQKNNNNLYQQLFSYTSNNFENLHCNQMPGYFWPQALTWNSVSIEEDRAFYVDPDFKTVGFLSSIVLRCDEDRRLEFHQLKLESTQNKQLQKPW